MGGGAGVVCGRWAGKEVATKLGQVCECNGAGARIRPWKNRRLYKCVWGCSLRAGVRCFSALFVGSMCGLGGIAKGGGCMGRNSPSFL